MKADKIIRVLLGVIFVMTGIMKLAIAQFGNAFSIQLLEAEIPYQQIVFWIVPIIEVGIGLMLILNYKSIVALFAIIPIMLIALYVHIVVSNPDAFPAQPQFPIVPILVLLMVAFLLRRSPYFKFLK